MSVFIQVEGPQGVSLLRRDSVVAVTTNRSGPDVSVYALMRTGSEEIVTLGTWYNAKEATRDAAILVDAVLRELEGY